MKQVVQPRSRENALEMAVVVQANLVQLKVADARRRKIDSTGHQINVPPPGAVKSCREALLDAAPIRAMDPTVLRLRLHEYWGRFCQMCWTFHLEFQDGNREQAPPDFSRLANRLEADQPEFHMRCATALGAKVEEINATLWKIKFEQRRRIDPVFEDNPLFKKWLPTAERIPACHDGKPIRTCTDDSLIVAGCEHAGMLATARWLADESRPWDHAEDMLVTGLPEV